MQSSNWREKIGGYDSIIFVAGIVHIKEKPELKDLYIKVNCDLAYETAKIAKTNGVKHFIFLSTKGVYKPNTALICADTQPAPTKLYGQNKLEGERLISKLADSSFCVSILRPPTVYGKGCKGNYPRLAELSRKLPIIPDVKSKRSMIIIFNLCEFIRQVLDRKMDGVLFPQDDEYVCTTEMMERVAREHHKSPKRSALLGKIVMIAANRIGKLRTMFFDSFYERTMSEYGFKYCLYSFEDAIHICESNSVNLRCTLQRDDIK